MFALPATALNVSHANATIINLDQKEKIILLYLQMVTFPTLGVPTDTSLTDLYDLRDLCIYMESAEWVHEIDWKLPCRARSGKEKSWDTFVLAGQKGEVRIARFAIGRSAEDDGNAMKTFPKAVFLGAFCDISQLWLAELFKTNVTVFDGTRPKTAENWLTVASYFLNDLQDVTMKDVGGDGEMRCVNCRAKTKWTARQRISEGC